MKDIIQQLTAEGRYEEALHMLNERIGECPEDDEAYYLRGALHKQLGRWGESLSDLNKAIALNSDSPAATLRQMLQEIIDFRHTDLLNP